MDSSHWLKFWSGKPLTHKIMECKNFLPVKEKTLIDHQLDQFWKQTVSTICTVLEKIHGQIEITRCDHAAEPFLLCQNSPHMQH